MAVRNAKIEGGTGAESDPEHGPDQGRASITVDRQSQTATFHSSTDSPLQYAVGDIVGESYLLERLVGRGGMGVVFRAKHIIMSQQYAVKLLAPQQMSDQSWRRFEVEGRALARLHHTNIVTIYNMGVDRGRCPFYVMDWLPGISLADRLAEEGPISEAEALNIFLQVCSGLSCAHKNDIIHRDMKPANIMLCPSPGGQQVKIVDFGMARLNSEQALTAVGEVFGSPLYMSPEQCRGEIMDARSDIYSVGCSIFECLTGRTPFRGATALETLFMHQEEAAPLLSAIKSDTKFSTDLETIVAKCLGKPKDERYQSIDQLSVDLQRLADGKPLGRGSESTNTATPQFRLFDDSEDSQNSNQPQAKTKSRFKTLAFSLAALLGLLGLATVAAATHRWVNSPNLKLPPATLHIESEIPLAGGSIANSSAAETRAPSRVAQELKNWPQVSEGLQQVAGRTQRCFRFPDFSMGTVSTLSQSDIGKAKDARGLVTFEPEQQVGIQFNELLNECPTFVDKFDAEDIFLLKLNKIDDVEKVIERLIKWKNLELLNLNECSISDASLKDLDKLASLKQLAIKKTPLKWQTFIRLKCLPRLRYLYISECCESNLLLQNLPAMPHLKALDLGDTKEDPITMKTLNRIAKFKNLKMLSLSKTSSALKKDKREKITEFLSDDTLNAHKLSALITEEMIGTLSAMKLDALQLTKPDWSENKIRDLVKRVPAVLVNDWARGYNN